MRVIAGKARRIQLVTPRGDFTRPTTDRIKETLFNILAPDLYDTRFLDLFSGSGGIGIEALSRGAAEAVFVENGRDAIACIKENLRRTRLFDRGRLIEGDVFSALRRLDSEKKPFGIIFLDPPYEAGYYEKTLEWIAGSSLTDRDTLIVAEALKETDFSFAVSAGLSVVREKIYKTNKHVFLRLADKEDK
ncbi:MAG: 16S rRNA (guanine(966)-N(2))-methyltransferase RsmD [Lachnospiraceae bacterium]|nr:16S rRNA (guanine(966)-N(2))-methyltransferase RsmD [Lachnospiraceae bacterium]